MADTTEPGAELEPVLRSLPQPRQLAQILQDAINAHAVAEQSGRQQIDGPERVYGLARWLQGIAENLEEWGRAFASGSALAHQYAEEELIEAMGEQDHIPIGNLTVPDPEGDIRLERIFSKGREFDADALRRIVAGNTIRYPLVPEPEPQREDESWTEYEQRYNVWLSEVIQGALVTYTELGGFTPQVSKVNAYAKACALRGDDDVAARVRQTVRSLPEEYTGVKMTRVKPKG